MKPKTETNTTSLVVVGVDIGKEVFHLVGLSVDGKIAFRRKIRRLGLKEAFEQLPPCIVGMEACLSAHFVSRVLRELGHEPRIVPAIYTKPFVKGQKNDYNDADAIAEAALRPNLRIVREKSQDQLDLGNTILRPADIGLMGPMPPARPPTLPEPECDCAARYLPARETRGAQREGTDGVRCMAWGGSVVSPQGAYPSRTHL